MNTIENGAATDGGAQVATQTMLVRINPSLNRKDAAWVLKVLEAIQADNVPGLNRLLGEKKRPVHGKPCISLMDGQPEAKEMSFLQFSTVAQSYACVEALSMRWHVAGIHSEVDEAVMTFLQAYEAKPEFRSNPTFFLTMAAFARGVIKGQDRSANYGVAWFSFAHPMATRAVSHIYAEQTPTPGPKAKLFQNRGYWLRQAARCIADNDSAGLSGCLAELYALPNPLPKGMEFMELHILLMSCVAMKHASCTGPVFKCLAGMGDMAQANALNQHFLLQLATSLAGVGACLSAAVEDELAAGIASVILSFDAGSLSRETLLASLHSKKFQWNIGPVSAVAKKAAMQVECETECEALEAFTLSESTAPIRRLSASL